jgi:hypothetical protein
MKETEFSNKCQILTSVWLECRDIEKFQDFIEYNDIGLPLAYMIIAELVANSVKAEAIINESFDNLLELLGIPEDMGFNNFDELIAKV